jgi:hypothetical protein
MQTALFSLRFLGHPKGEFARYAKTKSVDLFLQTIRKGVIQRKMHEKIFRWKETMARL